MLENYSIYAEKTEAILKEIERHSFVVDPDTRVVEMSIAQDAVEDAFNYSEERKIIIKPLEFKDDIAFTPVGTYIIFDYGGSIPVKWYTKQCTYNSNSREDAIKSANDHYRSMVNNIIKQCLISEE